MPLGSVMNTALSGLAAAESLLDAAAHNMTNVRTPGYRRVQATLASQTPQTTSRGAAPTDDSAGQNPTQMGRGVMVLGQEPVRDDAVSAGQTDLLASDVAQNLLDLDSASTQFRINLPVLSETDRLLDELVNLRRHS